MKQNYQFGDCLELMQALPDESIDLVLTSPPFKEEDVEGDYWTFYDSFFTEAYRVARNAVVILHSATKLNELIAKYPPKRMMIWNKGLICPTYRFNPILVYQKGDHYKVNKYIWSDVFGYQPVTGSDKKHPYQDPDLLYRSLIEMFKDCDSVLDPFLGSGTTLRACIELDKDFVGFEKNPEYTQVIESMMIHSRPTTLESFT